MDMTMVYYGLFGIPVYTVLLVVTGSILKLFWDYLTTSEIYKGPKKKTE